MSPTSVLCRSRQVLARRSGGRQAPRRSEAERPHRILAAVCAGICLFSASARLVAQAPTTILAFGDNSYGQCVVPQLAPGESYTAAACGVRHTAALLADGTVRVWGDDTYGQVSGLPALPTGVTYVEVASGAYHNLARRSDGAVVAWGYNLHGQCNVPAFPPGPACVQISAGYRHSVARLSDGTALAWGDNSYGQCTLTPPPGTTYVDLAARNDQTLALLSDGTVVGVGDNRWGELSIPTLPPGQAFARIAAGVNHSIGLLTDGSVLVWGSNTYGQDAVPALPPGVTYVEIAGGWDHTVARRSDDVVVAWGRNDHGQCDVPSTPIGVTYLKIASHADHTVLMLPASMPVPWGPDPAFGTVGLVVVGSPSVQEQAKRLLVDSQGRILVVGTRNAGNGAVVAVWRFLAGGVLDATFGLGGLVIASPGITRDATLEPGDDVVVLSHGLTRILANGQVDANFGAGGFAAIPSNLPGFGSAALALVRRNSGALFVALNNQTGLYFSNLAAAQFMQNGTPDPGFGTGGTILYAPGDTFPAACTLDSNGNVVMAGMQRYFVSSAMYVAGLDAANAIAWERGAGFGGTYDRAFAIAHDNGRIWAGGNAENTNANALARLSANGSFDAGFGTLGLVSTVGQPGINRIVPQSNGDLYVTGSGGFGVLRYNSNGQVDPAWGSNGVLSTSLPVGTEDFAFLPDGSLVVVGTVTSGGNSDVALFHYVPVPPVYSYMAAGCPGSLGIPTNNAPALARLGHTLVVNIGNLPTPAAGILWLGLSNTVWPYGPLPVDLGVIGAPGCLLRVSNDLELFGVGAGSTISFAQPIPNSTTFLSLPFYTQGFALDPPANPFGVSASDAASGVIGY